jgi:hypothetical protein
MSKVIIRKGVDLALEQRQDAGWRFGRLAADVPRW